MHTAWGNAKNRTMGSQHYNGMRERGQTTAHPGKYGMGGKVSVASSSFYQVPSGILIHPAIWPQQTWAENWRGAAVPFSGGWRGAGSPSNTMWPGLRPTSIPSGIMIHPAIWLQQTWAKNWGRGLCPLGGWGAGSFYQVPDSGAKQHW